MCILDIIEIDRCIFGAYLMGNVDATALDRSMFAVARLNMYVHT